MAKPLNERIASARSTDRVTIETLREVIADATAERDRQASIHSAAEADSTDIALSDADRDEAAATAARAARLVSAYTAALGELELKLDQKLKSESRKAIEAERASALVERDELAQQFREVVPDAVGKLIDLFAAIQKNTERMVAAGVRERDAEAEARAVPGSWYVSGAPVERFLQMKIPNLAGSGRCWPVPAGFNPDRGRKQFFDERERMMDAARKWQRYLVRPPQNISEPIEITTRNGALTVRAEPVITMMTEEMADQARSSGCKVEIAPLNLSVGSPAVGAF